MASRKSICPDCLLPRDECLGHDDEEDSEVEQDMTFGTALAVLRNGGRVTRAAWGDSGSFLYLVPGSTFTVNRAPLLGIYEQGKVISYRPHIDIRANDGTCSPWQPSQDALMAEDWYEV